MKGCKSFILLVQGLSISSCCTFMFNTIGILWLQNVTESGSLVGLFLLAGGLPLILMLLVGGVLADRFNRRNIIVFADGFSCVTIFSLALLFILSDEVSIYIIGLITSQLLLCAFLGVAGPVYFSMLPDLLSKERLSLGNVILSTSLMITGILGRSVGGVLFSTWTLVSLLLIISIGYLLTAVLKRCIQVPVNNENINGVQIKNRSVNPIQDIFNGFSYVFENKVLRNVLGIKLACHWCTGALLVTSPFLVVSHFNKGVEWTGYLMVVMMIGAGIGTVLGGMQFNQLYGFGNRVMLYRICLLMLPVLCIGLAFTDNIIFAMLLVLLINFCPGVTDTFVLTQLQHVVTDDLRGRTISVYMMISQIATIFSFLIGIIIDASGNSIVFVQGLVGVVAILCIYPLLFSGTWLEFIGFSNQGKGRAVGFDS